MKYSQVEMYLSPLVEIKYTDLKSEHPFSNFFIRATFLLSPPLSFPILLDWGHRGYLIGTQHASHSTSHPPSWFPQNRGYSLLASDLHLTPIHFFPTGKSVAEFTDKPVHMQSPPLLGKMPPVQYRTCYSRAHKRSCYKNHCISYKCPPPDFSNTC